MSEYSFVERARRQQLVDYSAGLIDEWAHNDDSVPDVDRRIFTAATTVFERRTVADDRATGLINPFHARLYSKVVRSSKPCYQMMMAECGLMIPGIPCYEDRFDFLLKIPRYHLLPSTCAVIEDSLERHKSAQ